MNTTNKKNNTFTPANAAIILVDHQPGVLSMVKSLPHEVVTTNAAILARLGEELNLAMVITSTRENLDFLGTTITEIQEAAPKKYKNRIRRAGTLNAFADKAFSNAIKNLNRNNLVIAGLITDVCLLNTVIGALEEGYQVQVVADASGTSTELGDKVIYDRLRDLGAVITTTYGILFEMYSDLSTSDGQRAEAIAGNAFAEHA